MAEVAVSFILKQLVSIVGNEVDLLTGVPREFAGIKGELESIRAVLKDADRRAADEGEEREGIKTWVKQLREACFRIENVIDEYKFYMAHRSRYPKCAPFVSKSLKTYHQIAVEIQDIKSTLAEINERKDRYMFQSFDERGSSSSLHGEYDPRMAAYFIEEAELVGFTAPIRQMIDWLRGGEAERTTISIVGMGGLGKTTLAKQIYDSPEVINHFDCRAWITVSQTYTVERLLREMMEQFCEAAREPLPEDLFRMDKLKLIKEVKNYLQRYRYVVVFDDVWRVEFWGEIEHAMPNNKKGSRIVITTRKMDVAKFCMTSSLCHVHEQKPLQFTDAWELFCKKTFRSDGVCPPDLVEISKEIVRRCEGLPLAIVAIGGLLSTKRRVVDDWAELYQNLSSELESNPHLTSLTRILAFSYDDLPLYLKSCYLYFGIYPEDYSISCARLTKKWIAEGFVEPVEGKTLEKVAEEYINELIHRSLVQVSDIHLEGTAKTCRIHDMLREMIIRRMKDLSFARFVHDDDEFILDTITRRLAIATSSDSVLRRVGHPYIRAVYIFESDASHTESFFGTIPSKFVLLKVLDFENALLNNVPDNLEKMYHLKYLSLRNTSVQILPKSIGKLLNLETLDLRNTLVSELPDQIKKLARLRHLLVYRQNRLNSSLNEENGVKIREGVIGCMTSLQKLYYVQTNHNRINLIEELIKLRQLRKLGLKQLKREYGAALCASIRGMEKLESLDITAIHDHILDLHHISSPPKLHKLCLLGRLESFPNWIRRLEFLVKLTVSYSNLNDDPLDSLKNLPSLLDLSICNNAYDGEVLCFQAGKFQRLKKLFLEGLNKLNSIIIENGTLLVLEELEIWSNPRLRVVPTGISSLQNLQVLDLTDLPAEFIRSIDPEVHGEHYNIIKNLDTVRIRTRGNPVRGIDVFHTRILHPRRREN